MASNMLQTLGDLCFIQKKHRLGNLGAFDKKTFSEYLISYGTIDFEYMNTDKYAVEKYKLLARDCAAAGLEVAEGPGWMKDNTWRHSGSNDDIACLKLTISLPISPALKVLYGEPNISK